MDDGSAYDKVKEILESREDKNKDYDVFFNILGNLLMTGNEIIESQSDFTQAFFPLMLIREIENIEESHDALENAIKPLITIRREQQDFIENIANETNKYIKIFTHEYCLLDEEIACLESLYQESH